MSTYYFIYRVSFSLLAAFAACCCITYAENMQIGNLKCERRQWQTATTSNNTNQQQQQRQRQLSVNYAKELATASTAASTSPSASALALASLHLSLECNRSVRNKLQNHVKCKLDSQFCYVLFSPPSPPPSFFFYSFFSLFYFFDVSLGLCNRIYGHINLG